MHVTFVVMLAPPARRADRRSTARAVLKPGIRLSLTTLSAKAEPDDRSASALI
jgi:hypothetical protein